MNILWLGNFNWRKGTRKERKFDSTVHCWYFHLVVYFVYGTFHFVTLLNNTFFSTNLKSQVQFTTEKIKLLCIYLKCRLTHLTPKGSHSSTWHFNLFNCLYSEMIGMNMKYRFKFIWVSVSLVGLLSCHWLFFCTFFCLFLFYIELLIVNPLYSCKCRNVILICHTL